MRWLRPLLFALTFAVPLTWAADPPAEKPAKPAPVENSELPAGKITLKLDPGRHTNWIRQLAFTPDGKQLLVCSSDATIAVWDVATWQRLRVLRLPGNWPGRCLAVSPDGRTLTRGFGIPGRKGSRTDLVGLLNLADGRFERVLRGHAITIQALVYTPDGTRLISGSSDKTVRIWDLTGQEPRVINTGRPVRGLAVSPDGKYLAEIGEDDDTTILRDLTTLKVVKSFKGGKLVLGDAVGGNLIGWSADGKHLATCAGDGLRLWTPDGTLRHHLLRSAGEPTWANLNFSADSRKLIGTDARKNRVVLFDVDSGKEERSFPLTEPRRCVLSPDGKIAVAARWNDAVIDGVVHGVSEVVAWNASDGKRLRQPIRSPGWLAGEYLEAGWSADGKKISWRKIDKPEEWEGGPTAFDLEELRLLEKPLPVKELRGPVLEQGGLSLKLIDKRNVEVREGDKRHALFTLGPNMPDIAADLVRDPLTFAGKDQAVLLGGWYAGNIWNLIFDVHTGKLQHRFGGDGNRHISAAPSPDGRLLLVLDTAQILWILNPAEGRRLLALFVHGKEWIIWTPQGYYAASPEGEKLMGWAVDNGINQAPSYHPAARFRKHFYRPDVIKLVLEKGNVEEALKAARVEGQAMEKVLPPRTSVSHKQAGPTVTVEVSADASSKEQPVTELTLLVDGRPAQLEGGQVAVKTFTPPLEKDARGAWNITLEPGKHKLSVRATSKDAYTISEEIAVEVEGTTRKGKLFYVGIGVNQFKNDPGLNLVGAVPDVRNLEKCLKDHCTKRYQVETTVLTDQDATLTAILKTLKELQGKLKQTDVAIVHYSSHGETDASDGSLYLLTHDSKIGNFKDTALSGQKLRDLLGEYPCPVLLILDACKSGKFPLSRSPVDPLSRMLADDSCGVAVLTAALAHQKAQDTEKGGVFTLALIEGLSGKARPEEVSKKLYVHHLFTYTFDTVARQTSMKQMPLYLPSGSVPPIVLKE